MKSLKNLFIITVFLAALGQIASDIYLPSLPYIAHDLQISSGMVQFTVAAFMLGFCLPRLIYGISSDAVGRRTPLLIGLVICLVGTIICCFATNIQFLIAGRFLQGLGAAAGVTVTGAAVRDCFSGTDLARFESYRAVVIVLVLTFVPLIGGYLQYFFGWRANFIATLLFSVFTLFLFFLLPETNKYVDKRHMKFAVIKSNAKTLLKTSSYLHYGVCIFMSYAGILAWLTLGPILLQNSLGISSIHFGWVSMVVGGSYVVGALINGRLVKRFGINKMLRAATWCLLVGGFSQLLFALIGIISIYVIVAPMMLFLFGTGFTFANSYTGALQPFPKIAGIAGSILGTFQILGGFLASSLMSLLPDTTQIPLAIILVFCAVSSFFAIRSVSSLEERF